jgi:SAM-dependent MidA family methyltransferase
MTTDQRWDESNAELVRIIRDEIQSTGPIRFDSFMELVLYHPELGYYRSELPGPGREGDFLTAPEAHPVFGATLATQIVDFDTLLENPDEFSIIEYGAGAGRLIRPLLAELRQQHPDLYSRARYIPIELNESRLAELVEHLSAGGHEERVRMHVPAGGISGCVLANEFIDAFPARRITRVDGRLHEVFVGWQDEWFVERIDPVTDSEIQGYLERHSITLRDGDWIEYHPGIAAWTDEVARNLKRGYILVIDYGYPANELLQDHRREGTLKAYYQHGASHEFYRGIGRQDLTAHVNLSEVIYQAGVHGLTLRGMTTQAEYLAALGIGERLQNLQNNPHVDADDYLAVRAAVLRMIDPGAMGRFRAVILNRNADDESSSSTDFESAAPERSWTSR